MTTIAGTSDSFLEETAQEAANQGFQVDLVTNMTGASLRDRPYRKICSVSWRRGFKLPTGTLKSISIIRRMMKSGEYSIIHTHTPTASAVTRMAAASLPRRRRPIIVYTAHGFHFGVGLERFSNRVAEVVERTLLRWTDVLMVINDEDEIWAHREAPSGTKVLRTNGVGIGERFFTIQRTNQTRMQARGQLGLRLNNFVAVSIGELNPNKRHELAIAAMSELKGARTLLILGEGPSHTELLDQSSKVQSEYINFGIRLEGKQQDIVPYLQAADCLIHPAAREGQPLVILEAMAAGLPVVAFRIRGCTDSLKDGRGFLAQGSSASSLASELEKIAAPDPDLSEIVQAARQYSDKFSRESLARETISLYIQLANPGAELSS